MSLLKRIDLVSVFIRQAHWDAAKRFYRETLGLAEQFVADEFGWAQYGNANESQIALSRWDDAAEPPRGGAIVVFAVEDAHAAVAELRRRGVSCQDPVGVPGMVTYASFYDLEGNHLQLAGPPPQG